MKIRIKSKPVIMTEEQRLILEGRRDRIIDKYAAQGVLKMALEYLANMDEKFNYKHFAWMAKQYAKLWNQLPEDEKADIAANGVKGRPARAQELNDLISSVSEFNKFKDLLTKKDINQYATLEDLIDGIKTDVYDKRVAKSRKERAKNPKTDSLIRANDAAIIYEDDTYFIIRPETAEASCYFGAKTRWCIAQEFNDYFRQYTEQDNKFFFFIKNDRLKEDNRNSKVALQVSMDSGGNFVYETLWDRYDDPIELNDLTTAEELADALAGNIDMSRTSAAAAANAINQDVQDNPPEFNEEKTLQEVQAEVDEITDQNSRPFRWSFSADVGDAGGWAGSEFAIVNLKLVVYSVIPEQVNLEDDRILEQIEEFLPNFADSYGLPIHNDVLEPDSITIHVVSRLAEGFGGSGIVKILYNDLGGYYSSHGEDILIETLGDQLREILATTQLINVTDPFIDGSFNDTTRDLLAMMDLLDDEMWYLSHVANSPVDTNSYWELEGTALDYTPSNNEYVTEVAYTSNFEIDLGELIRASGATPQQAAALFLSIGTDAELQSLIIRAVNKAAQEQGGNFSGTIIPFSFSGPESYYNTMDKIAEDEYDIEGSYDIKINVTNDEIDTIEKREALRQLIKNYDPDIVADALIQDEELAALLQNSTAPQSVTENKKRMKVRMIRG